MVTFTCPWCEVDELLTAADAVETELTFTCDDCGTSVSFSEEPRVALDLAA
jgi:transcription elongation factor Elf1